MKIGILGYGKMGMSIEKLLMHTSHEIVFKINNIPDSDQLNNIDVAIEFSKPDVAYKNISLLLNNKIPTVSGTTGWLNKKNKIYLESLCNINNVGFIYSSNFSLGLNILIKSLEYTTKIIKLNNLENKFNISINETHHINKKDTPSGTSISLAENMIHNSTRYIKWSVDKNENNSISIKSNRISDVFGIHEIDISSKLDNLSFIHKAKSRDSFAYGAILAMEWIIDKKGYFEFKDVLNLKDN